MSTSFTLFPSRPLFFRSFLFLLVLFSGISQASATHIAGGDIEYECIGNRQVKWLAAGPASLTVAQALNGCVDSSSILVTIGSVGLKEISSLQNILVKPNPNKGIFTIGLESARTQQVGATLYKYWANWCGAIRS